MKYAFEVSNKIKRCHMCIAFYIDDNVQLCLLDPEREIWWALPKPDDCPMQEVEE